MLPGISNDIFTGCSLHLVFFCAAVSMSINKIGLWGPFTVISEIPLTDSIPSLFVAKFSTLVYGWAACSLFADKFV